MVLVDLWWRCCFFVLVALFGMRIVHRVFYGLCIIFYFFWELEGLGGEGEGVLGTG